MIAATITRPEVVSDARPGIRFGLIEQALAPFLDALVAADPALASQLQRDLAVVVSAEALFCLTDLCGLSLDDAIDSVVRTAKTLTQAAFTQRWLHAGRLHAGWFHPGWRHPGWFHPGWLR